MNAKLNKILSKRPNDQLKDADPHIRTYIEELEKTLQNINGASNRGQENNKHQKKLLQQMQVLNKGLDFENQQMKKHIERLRLEIVNLQNCQHQRQYQRQPQPLSLSLPQPQRLDIISAELNRMVVGGGHNNDPNSNSVLIKGLTELQLSAIPKINIINLGNHMKIKMTEKDIVKVSQMERRFYAQHNLKPNTVILIVQFRTAELKIAFLKNKEKLKLQENLKDIEILDYVSEDVYNLYQYSKTLKLHGYDVVYWRNNCVYAKKNRSSFCEPEQIKSKKHVDSLKMQFKNI